MSGASLYVEGTSWLHRLHPAMKVAMAALLFAVFLAFNDPAYLAVATAGAVIIILLSVGAGPLARMGGFLLLLLVASTLLWAAFLEDPNAREMLPAWTWGPLAVTRGTALFGLAMALRIVGMVLVGLAVVTTTRPEEFSYGLRWLGLPPMLATAIALSFHLLPLFVTTGLIVRQAQQARGLELVRLPAWQRFMRSAAVAVPVMGYALRRADDLTRALELWGVGTCRPTFLRQRGITRGEVLLLVVVFAAAVACVYARVNGYGEMLPRL